MKLKEETTAPDVRVEIIPLIDVIFCILTFFILAALSLTRQPAINVDLPRAATGVTQMRQMLIVSVDSIGQTYIDRQPVTREQLQKALIDYQQKNPQGLMVLYASRSATYSDVVDVLDTLRSVGGDRVALATLPDATGTQPNSGLPSSSGQGIAPNGSLATPGLGLPGSTLPSGVPGATDPYNLNQDFPGTQTLPQPGGTDTFPAPGGGTATPKATTP